MRHYIYNVGFGYGFVHTITEARNMQKLIIKKGDTKNLHKDIRGFYIMKMKDNLAYDRIY